MSGTTISSLITVGVTLSSAAQNPVTVTSTGTLSVTGSGTTAIYADAGIVGTITNSGTIASANGNGIRLHWGGSVTNGSTADTSALISGVYGIEFDIHGPGGTLTNFAAVTGSSDGVFARSNLIVTNGASTSTAASIAGTNWGIDAIGTATVTNFGTIHGTGMFATGVYIRAGGTVTNGGTSDTTAAISGAQTGLQFGRGAGTVTNFGTISGTGTHGSGISLVAGGAVTNGSSTDTTARISAAGTFNTAIYIGTAAGTVVNFGTVTSTNGGAIDMEPGGTVTNGSVIDTSALISGFSSGVYLRGDAASTVTNFGTISATQGIDVQIYDGIGIVTNGSTADTAALIDGGGTGIYLGAGGTVTNFGTITGQTFSPIFLWAGGTIVNGSTADTSASIASLNMGAPQSAIVTDTGLTTVTNFATISSVTGSALQLAGAGVITNGSSTDKSASLIGVGGAFMGIAAVDLSIGNSTITNFGTITGRTGIAFAPGATGTVVNAGAIVSTDGAAGNAIDFSAGTNRLVVDPGASFVGNVFGGGSSDTLELATGTGSLNGIGSQFSNFGTLNVDSGGIWTIGGPNTASTVNDLGTLIIAAGGSLDVAGLVATTSTGTFEIGNGSTLEIAANTGSSDKIQFLGSSGHLIVDNASLFGTGIGSTKYKGPLIENFVAGDQIDLSNVEEAGATLKYTASSGLLQVTDGTTKLATLKFQTTTLGTGTFIPDNDGSGHLLIILATP